MDHPALRRVFIALRLRCETAARGRGFRLGFDRISLMLTSTRFPKFLATTAFYLSIGIMGAATAAIGPSLPALAENPSSGLDRISLIFVFGSLGYLIGSYFGGRGYDRVPGHKLMAVIVLALGAATALIPVAGSLSLLLLFMFL